MTQRRQNPGSLDIAAEIGAAAHGAQEAPDLTGGDADVPGPADAFEVREVPEDCPIKPLGFLAQSFYFLDFAGQLIKLGSEFRKGELMALFGVRMGWLEAWWPQMKRAPNNAVDDEGRPVFIKDGFSQKEAQQALIMACSKRGLFDPQGKVRGRGAHRGNDDELVLHCGDHVVVGGRKGVKGRLKSSTAFKPGLVNGYVYPTLPTLGRPAEDPASVDIGRMILELLKTWNWKLGDFAAYLLLCWIGAALLGGALRIRPHGWIVGPSGAGKTTLQKFLQLLMGEWGVFTEDATEAGVRQILNQDTLAVMFDEIEAEEDNREVVMKIVRLARLAYSGASSLRGSSDHQAKQFVARSCFLFSSIHHHELPAQDRNRIAILQLSQFIKDEHGMSPAQFLVPPETAAWGDSLRRRLIEQWPRFDATLGLYQAEMARQGYSGREQDTYGTLLACGDLLLHDDIPDPLALTEGADRTAKLVRQLGAIVSAARTEAIDTTERCIKHLASHRMPAKGGETPQTVARWIQQLLIAMGHGNADRRDSIRDRLGAHGLRVVHLQSGHEKGQGGLLDAYLLKKDDGKPMAMWLAVANKTNKGVQEIFGDSMWKGGVWTQSLALSEDAFHNKKSRFGGGPAEGCVLVPLDQMVDIEDAIREAEATRQG